MLNERNNILRTVRFDKPERIPLSFNVSSACWQSYPPSALQDMMAEHKLLFPNFKRTRHEVDPQHAPWRRSGEAYTDSWGCVWETSQNGITGTVVEHALSEWRHFENYRPPSPEEHDGWVPINWADIRQRILSKQAEGRLTRGSLRHGHTFLTLTYLRGYENLIFDMYDEQPLLCALIEMIEKFNLGLVERYIKSGVEWMSYPEDLGMQHGPMLTPALFRKYIKPTYQRLIHPAQKAGCIIHMHSDGDIRELAEDILDVGVDTLNLQDSVNTIDWIKKTLKGRICIDLDIDRQNITRLGTPEEIDQYVRDAVKELGTPEGGLMLSYGLYPGIPLDNIRAVMDSMEKYSLYFS